MADPGYRDTRVFESNAQVFAAGSRGVEDAAASGFSPPQRSGQADGCACRRYP